MGKKRREGSWSEEFKITFLGLDADSGLIALEDLVRSLEGWKCYWQTTTAIYLNKELSTKQLPKDIRPEIKIKSFKRGSFDVVALIVCPLALMVSYDLFKCLAKWQIDVLRNHLNAKRSLVSRRKAVTNLELFAKSNAIQLVKKLESSKVLDTIDQDLNEFVEPIDRSAKKIVLSSSSMKESLEVGFMDKRCLKSGYDLEDSPEGDYEKCSVKFIRINCETGNALVEFQNPYHLDQMGHLYSKIIDPSVKAPRNIYTRSFYEGTFIDVWGKIVRSKRTNKFRHWDLTAILPKEEPPLLE